MWVDSLENPLSGEQRHHARDHQPGAESGRLGRAAEAAQRQQLGAAAASSAAAAPAAAAAAGVHTRRRHLPARPLLRSRRRRCGHAADDDHVADVGGRGHGGGGHGRRRPTGPRQVHAHLQVADVRTEETRPGAVAHRRLGVTVATQDGARRRGRGTAFPPEDHAHWRRAQGDNSSCCCILSNHNY